MYSNCRRRPKSPPSDPSPAAALALGDACSSACPGCPECSLDAARAEHGAYDDDNGYCDACVAERQAARRAALVGPGPTINEMIAAAGLTTAPAPSITAGRKHVVDRGLVVFTGNAGEIAAWLDTRATGAAQVAA